MTHLQVRAVEGKSIRISGIEPYLAVCLQEAPAILERREDPAPQKRLFPDPTRADAQANAEWQEWVTPPLRHLFVSAGETMARDLTALQKETGNPRRFELTFPAAHLEAWMSALNQTRLILGELHRVSERDMTAPRLLGRTPKQKAILTIHLLGYLLQLFVELEGGE